MIRRNSIEAYREIQLNGLLSARRFEIYNYLFYSGPATATEISHGLQERNTNNANVRARLNELRDMGVVYEVQNVNCPYTGMTVIQWDVTDKLPKKLDRKHHDKPKMFNVSEFRKYLVDIGLPYQYRAQIDEYLGV